MGYNGPKILYLSRKSPLYEDLLLAYLYANAAYIVLQHRSSISIPDMLSLVERKSRWGLEKLGIDRTIDAQELCGGIFHQLASKGYLAHGMITTDRAEMSDQRNFYSLVTKMLWNLLLNGVLEYRLPVDKSRYLFNPEKSLHRYNLAFEEVYSLILS
jgi:hypothetical protein